MRSLQLISYSRVKAESFPSEISNKKKIPALLLLFNMVLEVLTIAIKQEKEIKVIQTIKEEVEIGIKEATRGGEKEVRRPSCWH